MWLTRLFRRTSLDAELDREMQFHLDAAIADNLRAGMSPDEARRRANIDFGGPEQMKEATRDARGTRFVEDAVADVRFALRAMRRSPAFAAAAVLTIAIGVGANTAVWSIMDALMNRSLPVAHPEQLHAIKRVGVDDDNYLISHPLMLRMQAAVADTAPVAGMGTISRLYATITDRAEGVLLQGVSGNFFTTLGLHSQLGRPITPDDDRTMGGSPVVVITESFWERRFGRSRDVVGKRIRINGYPVTIVGVIEPPFAGLTIGTSVDMFAPLTMQHELRYKGNAASSNSDNEKPWIPQNGISWLTLVTRVDPAHRARLAQQLDRPFRADLAMQIADRDSVERATLDKEHVALEPISLGFSSLRGEFRDPLRALFAGVVLILLITCANLTGLVLARGEARSHEIAIRASLGAMSGRLVRQVITESLTIALIGGAVGLLFARWAIQMLLLLASSGTRAIPLDATLDGRVLAFAFGVTVIAGAVIGLAPAIRVGRFNLYEAFKTGGRVAKGSSHRLPLGRLLVTAQIALALILVTSAGVFVQTFRNVVNIDAGYDRESVVTARFDLRAAGYNLDQTAGMYQRLLAAARAIPGVQSASMSLYGLGLGSRRTSGFTVVGQPSQKPAQETSVTPDFFHTVGIPILRGRSFTEADARGRGEVVIVSESFAKKFFKSTNVVGSRFGYGDSLRFEIVGVARDARVNGLKEKAPEIVYRALNQVPDFAYSMEVRFKGAASPVIAALNDAIASVDKNVPVREVVTVGSYIERGLTRERLVARLAGSFGILALLLSAIGLYGVISYSVARRTNEMGVRLALGASPAGVSWLVMRDSLVTVALGLAAGVALWFPILGLTRKLVFGVSPHDPALLAVSLGVLIVVGLLAGLIPAIRASRIDPIDAIRAD